MKSRRFAIACRYVVTVEAVPDDEPNVIINVVETPGDRLFREVMHHRMYFFSSTSPLGLTPSMDRQPEFLFY
jgi:hypothetical protein